MGAQNLPYILSDCDGTISNADLQVSEKTRASILKYQGASGSRFSFVTGRLGASSKVLARELKINLPVISCNGALITDLATQEVFYVQYLAKTLALELIGECEKNGIEVYAYTTGQMGGVRGNPRLELWKKYRQTLAKKDHWPILEYESMAEFKQAVIDEVIKPVELLMYTPKVDQQNAAQALIQKYQNLVEGNQSLPIMFNLTAPGVNKLSGLKEWAKIVGVDYQEIITIGDNYNDLPMIKGVKRGLVVGNAVDKVQQAAFKVLKPMNENGVGIELERIIEENE